MNWFRYSFFLGHFRYDQFGNNLNRYYMNPSKSEHPAIHAVQQVLRAYADSNKLAFYLDLHAHSSKKGCFMYGNVLDSIQCQTQNQLYCRLIALNTPFFDYQSCLFSKKHMFRVEPSDLSKGLSAEGSGRVSTYLLHRLIHSYTLECNYNSGARFNDVVQLEGKGISPHPFQSAYDKYTPETFYDVGRACMIAWLDMRGQNPASRLVRTKYRTLDRIRSFVIPEIKLKKEFRLLTELDKKVMKVDSNWRRCVSDAQNTDAESPEDEKSDSKIENPIRQASSNDSYLNAKSRKSEKKSNTIGLLSVTMANLTNRGNSKALVMTSKSRRSSSADASLAKQADVTKCNKMPPINVSTLAPNEGQSSRDGGRVEVTPSRNTRDSKDKHSILPIFIKA